MPAMCLRAAYLSLLIFIATAVAQRAVGEELFFDEGPIQVSEGELVFLVSDQYPSVLHSQNTLKISEESLQTGWVDIRQCYRQLDPVPDAEIVYRYTDMRDLRIVSHASIELVAVSGQSVQLKNVGKGASLCVATEARILNPTEEGRWVLVNGPFHRQFLDGYFPYRVSLEVIYPEALLRFMAVMPEPQDGFHVTARPGSVLIDSVFAGMLSIAVSFEKQH